MLAEIIIPVGDLTKGVAFYTSTCGLEYLRRRNINGRSIAVLAAGDVRVVLIEGNADDQVRVALRSDNATAAGRRLAEAGVRPEHRATETEGGTVLPFKDPWGNSLAFWELAERR